MSGIHHGRCGRTTPPADRLGPTWAKAGAMARLLRLDPPGRCEPRGPGGRVRADCSIISASLALS